MEQAFDWSARSLDDGLEGWQALLSRAWPPYREWWLQEGEAARPPMDLCYAAIDTHMHELLPLWERLGQAGTDEQKRFLSFWSPPAYIKACSQIAVTDPRPMLVRNYDYGADAFDCLVLRTDWLGRRVIGVSDGLWGLLDGMNDAGLVISLAFGGRWQVGAGFGIPLILRYALQMATTVDSAVKILTRIPSHMSYNVTCIDTSGRIATVILAPDRAPKVVERGYATNHQTETPDWPEHAERTHTRARFSCLGRLADSATRGEDLVQRFLQRPLYTADHSEGFGTLYTASYEPERGAMGLHWPGLTKRLSLDDAPRWDQRIITGGRYAPA